MVRGLANTEVRRGVARRGVAQGVAVDFQVGAILLVAAFLVVSVGSK